MVKRLSRQQLADEVRELGIAEGDTVHVQSDLARIGFVDAEPSFEGICGFHLDVLRDVIGDNGTLTCCASFDDAGRYGKPYVVEESPSSPDTFSEFLRTRPGAVRSTHPLAAVAALGPKAEALAGGTHFDGYGYLSPWARLHRDGAKLLTYGLDAHHRGTTFFHYVENLFGVPYTYTKIISAPVFKNGKRIEGTFTCDLRYLDFGIYYLPDRTKVRLLEEGYARELPTGRTKSWCAAMPDIVDQMCRYLEQDRWFNLVEPPAFRQGTMPLDGPTGAPEPSTGDSGDDNTED